MSTDNLTHHDVTHKAVIAQAAMLAADYTNDERKGILAQEELDRLAKIDFSATNAGAHFVGRLIEEAIDTAEKTNSSRLRQRVCNMWNAKLYERLGSPRSPSEADALMGDLSQVLVGFAHDEYTFEKQHSRWLGALYRLRPDSLNLGISAIFVNARAKWRLRRKG